MYKVFVNDRPIILTNTVEKEIEFQLFLLDTCDMEAVLKIALSENQKEIRLFHPDKSQLLPKLMKKLPVVTAGGGKVINQKGEILFIYRNDKWDLPKGKTEKGESIEDSAIRETVEETGVRGLMITKELPTTYHFFKRNGLYKLKVTYWFEMKTEYSGELVPEANEGIEQAVWKNEPQIKEALQNSYANIKLLFDESFLNSEEGAQTILQKSISE
jgi:ADP-ribose pyrophosphatase YjhB (NUDIX family)